MYEKTKTRLLSYAAIGAALLAGFALSPTVMNAVWAADTGSTTTETTTTDATTPQPPPKPDFTAMFNAMDTDSSGAVTKEEFVAWHKANPRPGGPGGPEGMAPPPGDEQDKGACEQGKGQRRGPGGPPEGMGPGGDPSTQFDEMDADKNSALTLEEFKTWQEAHPPRGPHGPGGPGGPGGPQDATQGDSASTASEDNG